MTSDDINLQVQGIDARIMELMRQRYELLRDAAKAGAGFKPEPETAQLKRVVELNAGVIPDQTLRAVFSEIIAGGSAIQKPLVVAFLGPLATFTHQAALSYFGRSVSYAPQKTIADVFDAVTREQAAFGVVPVENSTEGAVTHTLDMFPDAKVNICAEINMHIHHSLLCRCERSELQVIYSHPQVFGQCRRWLRENVPGVPLVEVSSTTEAASRCAQEPGAGALASRLAAESYGLPVCEEKIEDFTDNTTRFFVLGKECPQPTGDDKTSLMYVVRDRVGALYDSLRPFDKHSINMTMIESRPSKRRSWEYYFFVDVCGHASDDKLKMALDELADKCQLLRVLGSYPRASVAL